MKIALGQINPTVGDFDGNLRLAEDALAAAEAAGADLLVLPELALSGLSAARSVGTRRLRAGGHAQP